MLKFKLNGKDYEIKYKLRGLVYFEQISGQDYKVGGLMDSIILFYAFIYANYPDFDLSPDEFMDCLDEEPTLLNKFNKWLLDEQKKQQLLSSDEKTSSKKKKVKV